jgi:ligand-binding SRPBCC domain-containing protein
MTTLHHQIRIEAPIEAVWKAVSILTEVQHYNPMVASARFLSDRREGVGAMRRCELKPKGWVEERVWEWSPPHVIGLEVSASEWPIAFMKWRTELEKDGNATRISQDLSYKVKFGPLGALMDLLVMRRMLNKGVGGAFEALKRYVENGARNS